MMNYISARIEHESGVPEGGSLVKKRSGDGEHDDDGIDVACTIPMYLVLLLSQRMNIPFRLDSMGEG